MVVGINKDECIGCGECLPYCTVGAISLADDVAVIDGEMCVDCHVCARFDICPTEAIWAQETEEYPRLVRRISDPTLTKATGVPGRGTEEVKTNDVTGRVKRGQVGICIELGRPGVAAHLEDLEKVTSRLTPLGIRFEKENPMMSLLSDPERGLVKDEVKGERVLSTIVEFVIDESLVEDVVKELRAVEGELNTVFSLGMITRVDDDGTIPLVDTLADLGITPRPNCKVNLGMGKPLADEGGC